MLNFNHATPTFMGFQKTLPIEKGQQVTILKGTPIRHRGAVMYAAKTYTVTVHHTLSGMNVPYNDARRYHAVPGMDRDGVSPYLQVPVQNPMVVWAGAGGYWSEVDINYIPEAVAEINPVNTVSNYLKLATACVEMSEDLGVFFTNTFGNKHFPLPNFTCPADLISKLKGYWNGFNTPDERAAVDVVLSVVEA